MGQSEAMTAAFHKALKFTLQWEGGFVNDPDDPGGATNFGITHRTYDAWRKKHELKTQSVSKISKEEVEQIYFEEYWLAGKCDRLPDDLAIAHFDWCVNHGVAGATKHLQDVTFAKVDGIFGPKTEAAVYSAIHLRGEINVVSAYVARRKRWYDAGNPKFREGWMNRLKALKKLLQVK